MAYQGSYGERTAASGAEVSGWAVGLIFFASMLMLLVGGFHIIAGLAAVLDDTFYAVRPNFALEIDVSTWGWLHMAGGAIVMLAGIGLLSGSLAARILTIGIAIVSILWNFYSIPYYPVWAIMMIALAVGVIWALAFHGHDLEATDG